MEEKLLKGFDILNKSYSKDYYFNNTVSHNGKIWEIQKPERGYLFSTQTDFERVNQEYLSKIEEMNKQLSEESPDPALYKRAVCLIDNTQAFRKAKHELYVIWGYASLAGGVEKLQHLVDLKSAKVAQAMTRDLKKVKYLTNAEIKRLTLAGPSLMTNLVEACDVYCQENKPMQKRDALKELLKCLEKVDLDDELVSRIQDYVKEQNTQFLNKRLYEVIDAPVVKPFHPIKKVMSNQGYFPFREEMWCRYQKLDGDRLRVGFVSLGHGTLEKEITVDQLIKTYEEFLLGLKDVEKTRFEEEILQEIKLMCNKEFRIAIELPKIEDFAEIEQLANFVDSGRIIAQMNRELKKKEQLVKKDSRDWNQFVSTYNQVKASFKGNETILELIERIYKQVDETFSSPIDFLQFRTKKFLGKEKFPDLKALENNEELLEKYESYLKLVEEAGETKDADFIKKIISLQQDLFDGKIDDEVIIEISTRALSLFLSEDERAFLKENVSLFDQPLTDVEKNVLVGCFRKDKAKVFNKWLDNIQNNNLDKELYQGIQGFDLLLRKIKFSKGVLPEEFENASSVPKRPNPFEAALIEDGYLPAQLEGYWFKKDNATLGIAYLNPETHQLLRKETTPSGNGLDELTRSVFKGLLLEDVEDLTPYTKELVIEKLMNKIKEVLGYSISPESYKNILQLLKQLNMEHLFLFEKYLAWVDATKAAAKKGKKIQESALTDRLSATSEQLNDSLDPNGVSIALNLLVSLIEKIGFVNTQIFTDNVKMACATSKDNITIDKPPKKNDISSRNYRCTLWKFNEVINDPESCNWDRALVTLGFKVRGGGGYSTCTLGGIWERIRFEMIEGKELGDGTQLINKGVYKIAMATDDLVFEASIPLDLSKFQFDELKRQELFLDRIKSIAEMGDDTHFKSLQNREKEIGDGIREQSVDVIKNLFLFIDDKKEALSHGMEDITCQITGLEKIYEWTEKVFTKKFFPQFGAHLANRLRDSKFRTTYGDFIYVAARTGEVDINILAKELYEDPQARKQFVKTIEDLLQ